MTPDSTAALLLKGYTWLPDLRRRHDGAPVRARLLGRPVRILHGPRDVDFFYDERHVRRTGALPGFVLDTLFGRGAVHTLDGTAHHVRKKLFLDTLTDPGGVRALADLAGEEWRTAMARCRGRETVLFDEAAYVLARAVSAWAGLPPVDEATHRRLARDCVAMVDGFAGPGPRHLRARRARAYQERRLARVVEEARAHPAAPSPPTPFQAVVAHRDADGTLLDAPTAAVELLNIVRPTVAVAWFVTFAAQALHGAAKAAAEGGPDVVGRLADESSNGHAWAFAQEVRRFYPFVPFVGGLTADGLGPDGERLADGTMLLLDVYGQDHDPDLWDEPYRFQPERFLGASAHHEGLMIPQGGGPRDGHRCPGEDITVAVLGALVRELARTGFTVPEQDLRIPIHRIPTRPRSGFRVRVGERHSASRSSTARSTAP
ncbi:cytochrome P450 [Streptomyces exfoliatus]|uniref:cytochrome P450 n=1 Tax=Streptomyces exfoliatus TaxID=1905 RepID=UPI003C3088C5